jgi:hypothetical protein
MKRVERQTSFSGQLWVLLVNILDDLRLALEVLDPSVFAVAPLLSIAQRRDDERIEALD